MMRHALARYFGVQAAGSTLRREILGGVTIYAAMSYIVFVQPTVLSTVPRHDLRLRLGDFKD